MDEKIKQIWPKTKEFFAKMSKKTKRLLAIGIGGLALAAAVLLIFLVTRPYTTLFTGLNADNMQAVLNYLNNAGVHSYRVQNNDTILVPESQEAALKMALLLEGYPNQDSGYAMYLDNISSLSTNPDRQTLYIFNLQERLRAAICNIDGVRDAVVLITPGEDNSYILNRNAIIEASASVQVTMDPGRTLASNQAAAVRRLVAYAVEGLQIDNVSITDNYGNAYDYDLDGTLNVTDASRLKLALEEQVNRRLRRNILQVLEEMYGQGNVLVSVNTTVDVSDIYIDDISYTEPEWAQDGSTQGRGIIGTRVWSYSLGRDETGGVGGVVGADPNAELSTYVERAALNDQTLRELDASGEEQYLVDTTRTTRKGPGGTITDVTVAVTINADPTQGFTQDLRNQLVHHIAMAASIGSVDEQDKISLMVGQFWQEPEGNPIIPTNDFMWMIYAAIAGLIVFLLLLLIILLLLRRRRKKKRDKEEQANAIDAAAAALAAAQAQAESSADIMDIHTERSMELRKDVRKFAENNPEIAALMVKNWLNSDEDKR